MSVVTVLAGIGQSTARAANHGWLGLFAFIPDSAPPDESLGLLPYACVSGRGHLLGTRVCDRGPWLTILTLILTVLVQVHPEQEKPEPTPLVELEELSGSELTVFITPPEEPPVLEGSESTPQYW